MVKDESRPEKKQPRVLVVDDDQNVITMLRHALRRRSYLVRGTCSSEEALAWASEKGFDAAVIDLVMPEQDGMSLASALRARIPGLPIAICTGYTNSPLLKNAERSGVTVLTKPVATQEIVDFLESALVRS